MDDSPVEQRASSPAEVGTGQPTNHNFGAGARSMEVSGQDADIWHTHQVGKWINRFFFP